MNFELPDSELRKLYDALESFEDDFEEQFLKPTLQEVAKPVKDKMVKNIENATNKGYATGQTADSVKATIVKKKGKIDAIAIYPRGYDSDGDKKNTAGDRLRNMDKACYIEFGVSGRPANPMMQPAFIESEEEVNKIFVENLKDYAKKKGVSE